MIHRRSGILLHVTSLPSGEGIGDLGDWAYRFADFLAQSRQSLWQMLPICPVTPEARFSPYSGASAFAGYPMLISLEHLHRQGLLNKSDLEPLAQLGQDPSQADRSRVLHVKRSLLREATERALAHLPAGFEQFCEEQKYWLNDFAEFRAIRTSLDGQTWDRWPAGLRDRDANALSEARVRLADAIQGVKIRQFWFYEQWRSLRSYCNDRGIHLFGDMAMFMSHDSADVWAHPDYFQLGKDKRPFALAGMPPSRLAQGGQMWNMPLYDWTRLKQSGFEWWVHRVAHSLEMFSWLRVDHFLGFVRYWRIPAGATAAAQGEWVEGPGEDFFRRMFRRFTQLPFVVEDIGFLTAEARLLMQRYQLPGVSVVMEAFTGDPRLSRFVPYNYSTRSVAYTGTHDYNTARGWFDTQASPEDKQRFFDYVGWEVPADQVHWEMIRLALGSVCNAAVVPMQDVLGLGSEARMNTPGTADGNWTWRLQAKDLTPDISERLADLTRLYGRE